MKRNPIILYALITLLAAAAAVGFNGSAASDATSLAGLGDLFNPAKGAVRDANGDGLADGVAARIIVPAKPAPEDVLAAANIAGRLGFETTAMDLPLVLREDAAGGREIALPILIGRENSAIKRLVEQGAIDLKALSAGQGLIACVPSPFGGPDGIAVVGGDDEGTLAAANELAARLPRAWAMSGITLPAIGDQALRLPARQRRCAPADREPSARWSSTPTGAASPGSTCASRSRRRWRPGHRASRGSRSRASARPRTPDARILPMWRLPPVRSSPTARLRAGPRCSRSGLNSRTLTPPIDPDELAPDTRGRRPRRRAALGAGEKLRSDLRLLSRWLVRGCLSGSDP